MYARTNSPPSPKDRFWERTRRGEGINQTGKQHIDMQCWKLANLKQLQIVFRNVDGATRKLLYSEISSSSAAVTARGVNSIREPTDGSSTVWQGVVRDPSVKSTIFDARSRNKLSIRRLSKASVSSIFRLNINFKPSTRSSFSVASLFC